MVTDENREWVKQLLRRHERHILRLGAAQGWKFDPVVDLARIPGTLNHKSDPPKRVEVIKVSLTRYPLSAFEQYTDAHETTVLTASPSYRILSRSVQPGESSTAVPSCSTARMTPPPCPNLSSSP